MTYFKDLSDYTYHPHRAGTTTKLVWFGLGNQAKLTPPKTKNIGWLSRDYDFLKMTPERDVLDLIWSHCQNPVERTRGYHPCEFCSNTQSNYAEREGQRLLLGSAEIRVFARDGTVYAAPTLVYHYVAVHGYRAPDEFLQALRQGPRPTSREYCRKLKNLGFE